MLYKIILEQNLELKKIQSLSSITRDKFNDSEKLLKNSLIKVITGPRRAGKSTFALQLLKNKKFAYLNFDDENLLNYLKQNTTIELEDALKKIYGDFNFIFFDEIQTLEQWELLVSRLHRKGYQLIISGSNANLLSTELATHLTGRYVEINILPFSWNEYLKTPRAGTINSYLESGGFPEVAMSNVNPQNYLENLTNAILMKDIVTRKKIRQSSKLNTLYRYLSSIPTKSYSYETLAEISDIGSKHTVKKYLEYFQEAWLCLELKRFSIKQKEQPKAARKVYPIDPGLINESILIMESASRKLETQVLIDLIRDSLDPYSQIYYYQTKNNKEIDFIIKKKHRVDLLIQVCFDLSNSKTRKREISALLEASNELYCDKLVIVTLGSKELIQEKVPIEVVPLVEFKEYLERAY